MDLDARKLANPIKEQKARVLRKLVDQELEMLKNKILMATRLGYQQCQYSVIPSFQFPDPSSELIPAICEQLIRKNFDVFTGPNHTLLVCWGEDESGNRKRTEKPRL